ncbi:solute carrier organic anion transporter family member 1A2-like [Bufo gargarizans]|uniref:solute carrier organic anion transporter family member 1A2-like n=1 Tax=Bufo gargarizans TaxID=30331 RepID=UPI001CF29B62|nr:solute carrier organic anion transporter family member 1A2-like [Bufo gargarizans]XP_044137463.1 solute carrier organic anion transporter family member 1A2-like [Bufo gargarizans]
MRSRPNKAVNMSPNATPTAQKTRRVSTLKVFLFALSFAYITKSLALVYSRSMITQIERRFNIPSSLVGVIDGSFDIGNLLVITVVSYFGAKLHRPKLISIGCLIMFLGSCLTATPHFIMRRYQYEGLDSYSSDNSTSHVHLCLANQSQAAAPDIPEVCQAGSSESLMWIFVLIGNILQGMGETPIEPLGLSYVDDFAKEENSPFYIGIVQTLSIVGPLLGSLMASFCAQLFVDIGFINLDEVFISPTDTRWVGAWWLGFLVSGVLNLLAAVPFCFIPKTLPKEGQKDQSELRETLQPQITDERTEGDKAKEITAQGFLIFLKNLLKNKVYMLFLLVTVIQFSGFVGFMSFMPKYLEQQYGKSASEAIFLIGVYSIPVIGVGYFLGGFGMKKFKTSTFMAAKLGLGTSITEYLLYLLAFILLCKNASMAGLTVTYDGVEKVSYLENLTSGCNVNCGCTSDVWDPVCGDNGVGYLSACLAGCSSSTGSGQDVLFHNCSCIQSVNGSATLGQCPREEACDTMLLYFMILNLVCCFIYSLGAMPGYMVLIRSLTPEEKSFGLGLHLLAARALGGIPSPIYYGAAIDTTCIKWGTTSCKEPGACRMYDTDAYRNLFIGIPTVLRFVSYIPCIFILLALRRTSTRTQDGK